MKPDLITSEKNQLVKNMKALTLKKNREKTGQFIIEGKKALIEALASKASIDYVIFSEDMDEHEMDFIHKQLQQYDVKSYQLEYRLFNQISDIVTPQGVMAVVQIQQNNLNMITEEKQCILIADRIQDPGNLGTIIRTCHGAGIDALILTKGTVDLYNPKVIRSAMGSVFHIPVIKIDNDVEMIMYLKEKGFCIYASHLEASVEYYNAEYHYKTAVIIGNEGNGINEKLLELTDLSVKIPMPGNAESLNAAVAAGIILFEIRRQKALETRG